ncbi:magnesium chelatase, partial [Candidatus Parcubacteria bacterium]|nr:magnesium chelatase [Candidatus Parcubacteria bacterium]
MSVRLFSAALNGIEGKLIEVEVDSTSGLHAFTIVGLPDKAVEESKERIASAIRNNNLTPPSGKHKKILINLAPADIRKEGPAYDLPIAIGYLLETDQIKFDPQQKMFAGELSLDGSLKPIPGALSMAILAKELGFKEFILPVANSKETSAVEGIDIIPVQNIQDVVSHLNGMRPISPILPQVDLFKAQSTLESFSLIRGQEIAKRALAIAAAGGHNI